MDVGTYKISIVGTGNVAFHIAKRCLKKEIIVNQIIGRNIAKTKEYANLFNTAGSTSLAEIDDNVDVLIIAVQDDEIEGVAESLPNDLQCTVVHTSGSVSSQVLKEYANNGVFYPLQSFHRKRKTNWKKVPLLYNGNNDNSINKILTLVRLLKLKSFHVTDDEKLKTHVAAVIVNNQVSFLNKLTREYMVEENFDIEMILPLMDVTFSRCLNKKHAIPLTGPAARGDEEVIQKHVDLLQEYPSLQRIYSHISSSIIQYKELKKS